MTGRKFFVAWVIALGCNGIAWGHPPSAMDLTYNGSEKKLHVEVKHVSTNKRDHVVYKLVAFKNDVEVNTSKYLKQTSATMLISDIPLDAVPGDVLRVKAFCNDAGSREQTLIVP
jgi:hypothetical protein